MGPDGLAHHVINRGNNRHVVFHKGGDCRAPLNSPTPLCLSALVHKFGNVFCYAATGSAGRPLSSLCISVARSSLVNRHSNGVAMLS